MSKNARKLDRRNVRERYAMLGGAEIGGEGAPMYMPKKEAFKKAPQGGNALQNMGSLFDIGEGAVRLGANVIFHPEQTYNATKKGFYKDTERQRKYVHEKYDYMTRGGYGEPESRPENDEILYKEEKAFEYPKRSGKGFATSLYGKFTAPQTNMGADRIPRPPKREIRDIPARERNYEESEYKNYRYSPSSRLKARRSVGDILPMNLRSEIKPTSRFSLHNTFFDALQTNMHAERVARPPKKEIKDIPARETSFGELNLRAFSFPTSRLKIKKPVSDIPARKKKGGK